MTQPYAYSAALSYDADKQMSYFTATVIEWFDRWHFLSVSICLALTVCVGLPAMRRCSCTASAAGGLQCCSTAGGLLGGMC